MARLRAAVMRRGVAALALLSACRRNPAAPEADVWQRVALPVPAGYHDVAVKTIRGTGPQHP